MQATGSVAAAAVRQALDRVPSARGRKGSTTHGASMTGHVSEEIAVSVVSVRGESANAAAARQAGAVARPTRRASASVPEKPTPSTRVHQARCATQSGRASESAKNAPWGKR